MRTRCDLMRSLLGLLLFSLYLCGIVSAAGHAFQQPRAKHAEHLIDSATHHHQRRDVKASVDAARRPANVQRVLDEYTSKEGALKERLAQQLEAQRSKTEEADTKELSLLKAHLGDAVRAHDYGHPLVSIMIPTSLSRSWFVLNAVRMLNEQTVKRYEVIVVDEGGADRRSCIGSRPFEFEAQLEDSRRANRTETAHNEQNTARLVDDAHHTAASMNLHVVEARALGRIKYVCVEGRPSIGAKRSLATLLARATFVAFWDDDDLYARERLERQLTFALSRHLDLSVLGFDYVLDARRAPLQLFRTNDQRATYPHYGTLLLRRALAAEQHLLFNEVSLGEDYGFVTRAIDEHGATFGVVPRTDIEWCYVRHGAATWRSFNIERAEREGELQRVGDDVGTLSDESAAMASWPDWLREHGARVAHKLLSSGALTNAQPDEETERLEAVIDPAVLAQRRDDDGAAVSSADNDAFDSFDLHRRQAAAAANSYATFSYAPPSTPNPTPPPTPSPTCPPGVVMPIHSVANVGRTLSNGVFSAAVATAVGPGVQVGPAQFGVSSTAAGTNIQISEGASPSSDRWSAFLATVIGFDQLVRVTPFGVADIDGTSETREIHYVLAYANGVLVDAIPTFDHELALNPFIEATPPATDQVVLPNGAQFRGAPFIAPKLEFPGEVDPLDARRKVTWTFPEPLDTILILFGITGASPNVNRGLVVHDVLDQLEVQKCF